MILETYVNDSLKWTQSLRKDIILIKFKRRWIKWLENSVTTYIER